MKCGFIFANSYANLMCITVSSRCAPYVHHDCTYHTCNAGVYLRTISLFTSQDVRPRAISVNAREIEREKTLRTCLGV